MIDEQEQRQVWLAFASAAVSGFGSDKAMDDYAVADISSDVADLMLDAYLCRFEPGYESRFPDPPEPPEPAPKKRKKRR